MVSQKRQDILTAALRTISTHGFHGASMAMIAEEAHTGAGTIYNYFPDKEALIKTLFHEVKTEYIQAITQGIPVSDGIEACFYAMWRNAIQFNLTYPEKVAFSRQYHSSPYLDEEEQDWLEATMTPMIQPFLSAMQAGQIWSVPLPVLETYTLDVIVSLTTRHFRGEITLDDDLIAQTGQAAWHALTSLPQEAKG